MLDRNGNRKATDRRHGLGLELFLIEISVMLYQLLELDRDFVADNSET